MTTQSAMDRMFKGIEAAARQVYQARRKQVFNVYERHIDAPRLIGTDHPDLDLSAVDWNAWLPQEGLRTTAIKNVLLSSYRAQIRMHRNGSWLADKGKLERLHAAVLNEYLTEREICRVLRLRKERVAA